MLTIHQFNNEVRFFSDKKPIEDLEKGTRTNISRCDLEPRLTRVTVTPIHGGVQESYYAVDGVKVEDQSGNGVIAALENFPKPDEGGGNGEGPL